MENAKILVISKVAENYKPDTLFYCVHLKRKEGTIVEEFSSDALAAALKLGDFKGNEKESLIFYNNNKSLHFAAKRIVFIGIGVINKNINSDEIRERMRIAGGDIAKLCKKYKATKICIFPPKVLSHQETDTAFGLTEGIFLGSYCFTRYKTAKKDDEGFKNIKEIQYIVTKNNKNIRAEITLAKNGAISTGIARDMANEPGNGWTPDKFAVYAKELAKKYHFTTRVFAKKELEELGMGGILAVNRGSDLPPKLVIVEYIVSKKAKTILLVGKGLTFDSGGISLKPASGMEDMKYDMCGGAAVLATMESVGTNKPNCNVIAIVPATENMSGGSAVKPGDIVYHYNKTSTEIINTDAEGRLILADALAYGIEKYSPDCVIDLATLTGAVIIGLGHHHSGLMSNNDKLAKNLISAGRKSGEPLWRLPLGSHYAKQLESKVADIKNTGGRPGGAITAAEYLHAFVGDTPWAHLDIAGTAWNFTEKSYIPDGGPSGIGVRTLIEFINVYS